MKCPLQVGLQTSLDVFFATMTFKGHVADEAGAAVFQWEMELFVAVYDITLLFDYCRDIQDRYQLF